MVTVQVLQVTGKPPGYDQQLMIQRHYCCAVVHVRARSLGEPIRVEGILTPRLDFVLLPEAFLLCYVLRNDGSLALYITFLTAAKSRMAAQSVTVEELRFRN